MESNENEEMLNRIYEICSNEKSTNPFIIINRIMDDDFCNMHGPEHHFIVGASLLTSYYNSGADIDLKESLREMINRGRQVPGGFCGYWGACGAGISSGIFISLITNSRPLSREGFKLSNKMTSKALDKISDHGGPRCCKRDSYLSILSAIDFLDEYFNVKLDSCDIKCKYNHLNKTCLKDECPFYK